MAFAYYYASAGNAAMAAVTAFTLIGAGAVSYSRARAENEIDGKCDIGLGARMPRLALILFTTLAGFPEVGIIAVLLVSNFTVFQRISYTYLALKGRGAAGNSGGNKQ